MESREILFNIYDVLAIDPVLFRNGIDHSMVYANIRSYRNRGSTRQDIRYDNGYNDQRERIPECFLPGADTMTSNKSCECESHEKKAVVLPDGFTYHYFQCPKCSRVEYPLRQAQAFGLFEGPSVHVRRGLDTGLAVRIRCGFIGTDVGYYRNREADGDSLCEFAQEHDIPSEDPGLNAYGSGQYTERIDRALDTLYHAGLIHSKGWINTDSERFCLTEEGAERGKTILSKLDVETLEDLILLKCGL
ncbi:MAG: hypothetical protein ACI4Q9_01060 [Candidatus Methanomethylophilaceae archaeon]